MANANQVAVQAITQAAQKYGIDPQAMIAVGKVESGLNPQAIGDGGHAFGLFQFNNAGGVITGEPNPSKYLDPSYNALQAARHIATIKGIKGARGAAAIKLIVNNFERPANKGAEISKALTYYQGLSGAPSPTIPAKPSQTAPNGLVGQSTVSAQANISSPLGNLLDYAMKGSDPGGDGNSSTGNILSILANQGAVPEPTVTGAPINTTPTVPAQGGQAAPVGQANNTIVAAAEKFMGTPYLWGGTSAKGLDCSGLVQLAVKNATGKTIPRVASAQYAASTKVPQDQMQPGDIIAFGTPSNVHHIGIYVGNGKFINAPHTGTKVRIDSLAGRSDIVGAGRFPSK